MFELLLFRYCLYLDLCCWISAIWVVVEEAVGYIISLVLDLPSSLDMQRRRKRRKSWAVVSLSTISIFIFRLGFLYRQR